MNQPNKYFSQVFSHRNNLGLDVDEREIIIYM